MARQTFAEQVERARRIVSIAAADAELQARLAQVGYDDDALKQAQTLYNGVLNARTSTHAAHGEQLGATGGVAALREQVQAQVSALTQIARTVFAGNADALEALGLRLGERATPQTTPAPRADEFVVLADVPTEPPRPRQRSRSQAALLDRARTLYNGALANAAIMAELKRVGYTRERLEGERADVAAWEAQDIAQEGRKATAKATTAQQREALDALNNWLSRFRGIVRPALRDRPDLLDKLGV